MEGPEQVTQALVGALVRSGADTMFGVPGGGPNLALLGAAQAAGMRFVLTHSETAGAIAASTYGLLTGRAAPAIATRGPGAASVVNGAAQATLDRFPLLLVTDCVPPRQAELTLHQRIDQVAMFRPVTKWSGRLGSGLNTAEVAAIALAVANTPPRGAVHLDLDPSGPSDIVQAAWQAPSRTTVPRSEIASGLVASAKRPVAIVGLGANDTAQAVRGALEALGCPVLVTYQAVGVLPEGHPQLAGLYTGGIAEAPLLQTADVVVTVGLDNVEPIPSRWAYTASVVRVSDVVPETMFVQSELLLIGPLAATVRSLASNAGHDWPRDAGATAFAELRDQLRSAGSAPGRLASAGPAPGGLASAAGASSGSGSSGSGSSGSGSSGSGSSGSGSSGPVSFGPLELVDAVARAAPEGVTVTVDAGAHFLAIMPFWPVAGPAQLLISNGLATMGFAVPAAIGAALARPGRPVLCLVGDGGMGMTLPELETIARLDLPVTVVVFDDAALSLIEVKQQPGQGGHAAVRFRPIDFAAAARALGLDGTVATSVREVGAALAGGWDRPRLVDARIDPAGYSGLIKVTRG